MLEVWQANERLKRAGDWTALVGIVVALATCSLVAATAGGASGTETRKSVRDGVYTKAQAKRGEQVFAANCAVCHQPEQFVGAAFMSGWEGQPLFALFDTVRETMPQDNPGSLRREEYADLITYVLQLNGMPEGEQELAATDEALKQVVLEGPFDAKASAR